MSVYNIVLLAAVASVIIGLCALTAFVIAPGSLIVNFLSGLLYGVAGALVYIWLMRD